MDTNTITLTREEYDEFLRIQFVYEYERAEKIRQKKTGGYLSSEDKHLYRIEESEVE